MKKILFSFICFFIFSFVLAETYNLKIFDHSDYFEIQIISSKYYGTCHYLKPSLLFIQAPGESATGTISIDVEPDPNILPLQSPGQDMGCIEFSKGICLPKVDLGNYELIINDEYYGMLFVETNNTYLKTVFEVNYRTK